MAINIEKFDAHKHARLARVLPFRYACSKSYLEFAGYVLQCTNNSKQIVIQDIIYQNDFPFLTLPAPRVLWQNAIIDALSTDELAKIAQHVEITVKLSVGPEFYYSTNDFVNMPGAQWSKFRSRVHQCQRNYKIRLASDATKAQITQFTQKWLAQQRLRTKTFNESLNFFTSCVLRRQKNLRTVFAFDKNKLVGVAVGELFNKQQWVGLHLKVDYGYKGLSRLLHHERAKLFATTKEFTLGTPASDPGIALFKKELHPVRVEDRFYIMSGAKRKK